MEYSKARRIRKTGLFKLIAEKKFEEGQGLGSSIGGAISDKFKAKATGFKEAFDPLNMTRKLFGKGLIGDVAVTGLGRLFGRKESDIGYFGGFKRKAKKDPNFSSITPGVIRPLKFGDSVADILGKMYNFMLKTDEKKKVNDEIEASFRQEQIDEDERRHQELVKVVKKFTGKKTTATKDGKDDESGVLGGFAKLIKNLVGQIASWAGSLLSSIGNFFIKIVEMLSELALIRNFLKKFGYRGPKSDKDKKSQNRNKPGSVPPSEESKPSTGKKPTVRKEQEQKKQRTDKATRESRAKRNLPPGKTRTEVIREVTKKIEEKAGKKPLQQKVKKILAKYAARAGLKLSTIEVPVVGEIMAALTGLELYNAIEELYKAGAFDMTSSDMKEMMTDLVKESNEGKVRTTVTRPKNPEPTTKSQTIPSKIPVEKTLSAGEEIVAVNNTVNNIGGKKPKTLQMSTANSRNKDLDRYLRNASVVV